MDTYVVRARRICAAYVSNTNYTRLCVSVSICLKSELRCIYTIIIFFKIVCLHRQKVTVLFTLVRLLRVPVRPIRLAPQGKEYNSFPAFRFGFPKLLAANRICRKAQYESVSCWSRAKVVLQLLFDTRQSLSNFYYSCSTNSGAFKCTCVFKRYLSWMHTCNVLHVSKQYQLYYHFVFIAIGRQASTEQ